MEYYKDNFGEDFPTWDNMDSSDNGIGKRTSHKHVDKHYHCLKSSVKKYRANGKPDGFETIECYSTPYHGSNIRDAMSGSYTKYPVGSKEQSLFFKVVIALGTFVDGPAHLYYFSPEIYEQHHMCTVDESVKEDWRKTYKALCDELGL